MGKLKSVSWEESFMWCEMPMSDVQFNSASIRFEIEAANAFWRNTLIGTATVAGGCTVAVEVFRTSGRFLHLQIRRC